MESITLLGQEILTGTPAECNDHWNRCPADRHKIATHDEAASHDFDSPAQIAEWMEKKKARPGKSQLSIAEKHGRFEQF